MFAPSPATVADAEATLQKELEHVKACSPDGTGKRFGWERAIYKMPPKDVPSPGSVLPLVGSVAPSAGRGGADGACGVQDRLDWTAGRLAVLPVPAESSVPPLVGRIVEVVKGTQHEVLLNWYSPSRVEPGSPREQYGRGKWTQDFNPHDRRKPDQSKESMDAVILTSGGLLRDGRLHTYVWTVLQEQVSKCLRRGLTTKKTGDEGEMGKWRDNIVLESVIFRRKWLNVKEITGLALMVGAAGEIMGQDISCLSRRKKY